MKMVRSRSRRDVPDVQVPKRQATQWEIQSNAVLVELERKKSQHYEKWGVDRLITLVDIEFRAKFWVQMGRVWDAVDLGDIDRLHKAVNGMCKGFDALEKWAEENEIQPNPSIQFLEWKSVKGVPMVIVRTENEAVELQTHRKDISNGNIWTLEEIEVFLQEPQVQEIIKLKALVPTARVTKFTPKEGFGKGSGFDDMEDDLDAIFSGEPYVPKYKPIGAK
jgi:hypothetical protein